MKTARYIITFVHLVKRFRDKEYEMEFAVPVIFTVIASFIATVLLFCLTVQLANELAK